MAHIIAFSTGIACLLYAVCLPSASAGVPQPMVIYCGQALNGYGWPYTGDADVILLSGTNEITRHTITGPVAPGINFMLYLNIDDNRSTNRYANGTVVSGQEVSIIIHDVFGQQTIVQSNAIPPVGIPGTVTVVNVTAGIDSDADGLPDLWEWELVAFSGGALTNITDVHPGDDFDGDGSDNLEEYNAGTFAFLDYDYFYIDRAAPIVNGYFDISFITVPDKIYRLQSIEDLMTNDWQDHPYALSAGGALTTDFATGTGNRLHLYVPVGAGPTTLRLRVQ
ncbi:MAG: hypothetical protein EOM20_11595 [Spartobacteria bacterium]|nr:hypothetical protein [Spartobacteria bacterium]